MCAALISLATSFLRGGYSNLNAITMHDFQTINDIVSTAVKNSSYVTVIISSCVFILYTLIIKVVDYFKSITKWDIVDKKTGLTAFLRNYSTKDLSNKAIITEIDVNRIIQKEYPEGAYVDKDGIVQAAVERNRQYMLNKAKWKTELLKEKGLYGRK